MPYSMMAGVQTLLPLMLDHVHAGRLSLARLVDLTSAAPARVFGLAGKGRIAEGADAALKRMQEVLDATLPVFQRPLQAPDSRSPTGGDGKKT